MHLMKDYKQFIELFLKRSFIYKLPYNHTIGSRQEAATATAASSVKIVRLVHLIEIIVITIMNLITQEE
jgi:hypothetical protein